MKTFTRGLRSLYIVEHGPLDVNPCIAFLRLVSDFCSNVLAFSITISPEKQDFGEASLLSDVFRNGSHVLEVISLMTLISCG